MKNTKWVDRLDDREIKRILKKDLPVKKMPERLDEKMLKMIRERDKLFEGKKEVNYKFIIQFAYSVTVIPVIIIFTLLYVRFLGPGANDCIVSSLSGKAYALSGAGKTELKVNDRMHDRNSLIADEGSAVELKIGKESSVKIKESSDLKIVKLYRDYIKERTEFYINLGYSYYDLNMLSKKSSFHIETDLLRITVYGTKFSVNVNKDKSNDIEVYQGNVYVVQKFNLDYKFLKKVNRKFANRIKKSVESLITLKEGDIVNISIDELNNARDQIEKIINSIYEELRANFKDKKKTKEIIKNSEAKIKEIIEIRNFLFRNKRDSRENDGRERVKKAMFRTGKLTEISGTAFTARYSAVTADNASIYISSDSNNSVFCIESGTGKLLWKFANSSIRDITSPVIPFLNNLILSTPDKIIILDKSGNIKNSLNVTNGTKYWSYPVIADNKILIPTAQNIYCFDDASLNLFENFPESLGQLYISYSGNLLFYADSNENRVKIFDPAKKSVVWESAKLENRLFSPPLSADRHIYVSDLNKNIIRFDYLLSRQPDSLEIESGAVSNLVYNNGTIYLVNNSGWLYAIDASSFNRAVKIIKIDDNPDYNNYLTKKLLKDGEDLYFCSDKGKLFHYDLNKNKFEFINIKDNAGNNPLIGAPVKIGGNIYAADIKANIYRISKIYE